MLGLGQVPPWGSPECTSPVLEAHSAGLSGRRAAAAAAAAALAAVDALAVVAAAAAVLAAADACCRSRGVGPQELRPIVVPVLVRVQVLNSVVRRGHDSAPALV